MKHSGTNVPIIGKLMILVGVLVMAPVLILPWYAQEVRYIPYFLLPGGASVLLGVGSCFAGGGRKDTDITVDRKTVTGRASLIVLFAWSWGTLIGALPFFLSGQLTFVQSLFEAVSGWTTTGLSVIDVRETPYIYLFHRSFMQYCGGLGFIMVMILFISSKQSMDLYSAEGHPDKIMPNIKKTAQAIFIIYTICLVLGTAAYRIAGMTWFDGICHAMCSLSTGGFSTKLNSIGEYDSLAIEIITIVLMLIGTTNFAALILLARGKVRSFFKVSEVRYMFLLLLIFIPPTALSLMEGLGISFWEGLRRSSFDIVSAMSTSGYSSMSYAEWPPFAVGVLILMMIIGGGIGSTAGGMKLSRVYLMMRVAGENIRRKLSPARSVQAPKYMKASGRTAIDAALIDETTGFLASYLVVYVIGTLALSLTADCSLTEAMFDFASSLSTVGLSIGITNPSTAPAALIVEMIGMFLGRLEIFIVVVGIVSGYRMLFHRNRG